MLIVYTGNGKGKTTASFGLALRAVGYDKKVCILQFIKEESWPEGARKAIRSSSLNEQIDIKALGSGFVGIMGDTKPRKVHKENATKALKMAQEVIRKGKHDIVILDELIGALVGKLVTKAEVEKTIKLYKKTDIDLILSGRNAPKWLIDKADLVTEMKEIKHPFQKGIRAKKGVDF